MTYCFRAAGAAIFLGLTLRSPTPAWVLDASSFRALVEALGVALKRPPSATLAAIALGGQAQSVAESVRLVADASRVAQTDIRTALSAVPGAIAGAGDAGRLASLVAELSGLWRVRVAMAIRPRRVQLLRDLLREPAPDLLRIIHKEHDENAHSDVLRWLLDPRTAPNIAPVVLRDLVSRLPNPEAWRAALQAGLAADGVYVRREVVIGDDLKEGQNRDRIDLVIDGPGFVLGIENKVWADEHAGQTQSYARWLAALAKTKASGRAVLTAGLFLSPTGAFAGSSSFSSLSYLELCACLLEGGATDLLRTERQVLAGYMKTLSKRVLRSEFRAIVDMEGEYERIE